MRTGDPADDGGRLLGVAHFRRTWFKATESFLYHPIAGAERTRPLLVGYERALEERFPVACPSVALYPPGSRRARLLAAGARLLRADPHRAWLTPQLLVALRRHRARVLHAHFGYTGHQILPVARATGLPLVTSFYGEDASRLAGEPGWRERFAELFARGARFLAEGPAMRQRLVALGCPPEKLAIHPISIPVARYPFRERSREAGRPLRLFFCGSFREKKGLAYALEAFARVRPDHPELAFRIAGDGPERPALEALIDRLALRECVELLGPVPHDRFVKELDEADLFVSPSVTAGNGDSEGGAPTTLLEAQACGVPVLATFHADVPNVVGHGESGLLAPERDADALAGNLERLVDEPERWAAMGRAGRARVERYHDVAQGVRRLEALYLTLAGQLA